jgi:hypothetical protein
MVITDVSGSESKPILHSTSQADDVVPLRFRWSSSSGELLTGSEGRKDLWDLNLCAHEG